MQRVFVYFALLSPSALLGLGIWSDAFRSTFYLGADPAEYVLETLGQTAAILFLITLLISPLRRLGLVSSALLRFRRAIGVASFFYALAHALLFAQFYVGWSASALGSELLERPYVAVGAIALILMSLLAITSNNASVKLLAQRWRLLHRSSYLVAMLFLIHYLWQVRSDYSEFAVFLIVVLFALGERLWHFLRHSVIQR
jgi:sulfoxide reductase heme-binding subunit YedZ